VIAVVRRLPGRPQEAVPRWTDARALVVVVGPDGPGLLIDRGAKIWVEVNALIGILGRGAEPARLIFWDCTCGRRRRKCVCGARRGEVLHWYKPFGDGAWRVVDDEQHELGRITLRRSAISREDTGAGGTRTMLARWVRAARTSFPSRPMHRPMHFELVEAEPGFDWRRDGLFVALAVLCDQHAHGHVFPMGGAS
jgi:hypothetical protein